MSKPQYNHQKIQSKAHADALINRDTTSSQAKRRRGSLQHARHITSVEHYEDQYRIIKNTYGSSKVKETHTYSNNIDPVETVQVPEALKEVF